MTKAQAQAKVQAPATGHRPPSIVNRPLPSVVLEVIEDDLVAEAALVVADGHHEEHDLAHLGVAEREGALLEHDVAGAVEVEREALHPPDLVGLRVVALDLGQLQLDGPRRLAAHDELCADVPPALLFGRSQGHTGLFSGLASGGTVAPRA